MWPFDKKRTEHKRAAEPSEQGATSRSVTPAELLALDVRMERLERLVKSLDTDWSEWFDKFRRLYARIAKRQERDEDASEPSKDAPEETIAPPVHPHHHLPGTSHLAQRFKIGG